MATHNVNLDGIQTQKNSDRWHFVGVYLVS